MKQLTLQQKQKVTGGAIPIAALGAKTIKALHGILTISWVVLEAINIATDYMSKTEKNKKQNYYTKQPYEPKKPTGLVLNNDLQSSIVTIGA